MENLKIITTDIFLEKFDNHTLENEDLKAIYFQKIFENTNNSYWEEVENGEYYIVFKSRLALPLLRAKASPEGWKERLHDR